MSVGDLVTTVWEVQDGLPVPGAILGHVINLDDWLGVAVVQWDDSEPTTERIADLVTL